ncbi:DUF4403 family protein [Rufibacter psychrotolerans]|uniref:DUF4403 family protein n=1 Tax=Rufibacter psychrotolerans TaxID=2812556 RepID=UPI0019683954|nr:DUF4403 family protein [Rufibacter sp. SYSU D00308]
MAQRSLLSLVSILLSAAGLLAGCQQSTTLTGVQPDATVAPQPLPQPQLSTITLPVTMPVKALQERINQELPPTLYQDTNLEDDDLMVTVTKTGPVQLRAELSKLYMEVPLRVWARGRWQWNACELCKKLQKTEETEFEVTVCTESRLQILPNYLLKSHSTGDFTWGARKPTLALGPLKINLAPFIESKLKAQLNPMLQQLDQELQKKVPLQLYLAEAWQQLQTPVLLNAQYNAWLAIEPKAVRLTPLELQQDQLSLQVGIDALVQVVPGQKPQNATVQALPSFIPARSLPPQAQLNVSSHLSYAYLTQVLRKELNNQTFSFEGGKHQLTVHDIAVAGKGTQLLLALDVSGHSKAGFLTKKLNGKVWLQGTPYYDAAAQEIKVRDLSYTLQTRDQLVNTANWLLQNRFRTQMEQQMTVPVKGQLTTLREALQTGLRETQLQEKMVLRGSDFTLEPDTLFVTEAGIRAHFLATGKLALFFQ